MRNTFIEDISEFLGKEDTRYFSNGFRFMDYVYEDIAYTENELTGNVYIRNNARTIEDAEPCHLGTIEYIAIASTFCEKILISAFNLSENSIANSWIDYCKMKVSSCTYLDRDCSVRVVGKIRNTAKDANSINGYKSHCEVRVGSILIKMGIDHPTKIRTEEHPASNPEIDMSGMYVWGYRNRKHTIENVFYSIKEKTCSASLSIDDYCKDRKGLGANYQAVILPDIINISGQLSQVLLYKLENTERQSANNMWLRECSIIYNRPYEERQCRGEVNFSRFDEVLVKGEPWRSVTLSSHIGGISSQFRIAHKINSNQ